MSKPRLCIVENCKVAVDTRHPMCPDHWHALPGRMRSSLSYTARCARSPVTDDAWRRACAVATASKGRG